MLLTLTSLSGLYSISNMILIKNNKNLLKNNKFLSLRGEKTLGEITISKDSILYKVNYIKNDDFLINDNILNCQFDKFNTVDECKHFCIENKLEFENNFYNKIVIDDLNNNIWVLCKDKKYTIVKKMTYNDFKNQIIKTNQLPFNKLNMILFLILLIIYNESNY